MNYKKFMSLFFKTKLYKTVEKRKNMPRIYQVLSRSSPVSNEVFLYESKIFLYESKISKIRVALYFPTISVRKKGSINLQKHNLKPYLRLY